MLSKTTALAAAIALSASTAFAGGLSPEIVEAPVMEEAVAPPAPSINPTYVVVGILAALLIAAAVNGDDDTEVLSENDDGDDVQVCTVSSKVSEGPICK